MTGYVQRLKPHSVWFSRMALFAGVGLVLAACDRVQRVGEIADASREQIAAWGKEVPAAQIQLEALSPEERAISGRIASAVDDETRVAPMAYFVVGSVIAKPLEAMIEDVAVAVPEDAPPEAFADLAEVPAEDGSPQLMIAQPEGLRLQGIIAPAPNEGVMPDAQTQPAPDSPPAPAEPVPGGPSPNGSNSVKVGPGDIARPPIVTNRLPPRPAPIVGAPRVGAAPVLPDLPEGSRMAVRRMAGAPVRSRAEEALAQLGLSGTLGSGSNGEVIINIGGGAPTAFPSETSLSRGAEPMFAIAGAKECPRNVSAQQVQADPVLATACVVKVLQESGEFEYVEPDYIFSHEMERAPKKPTIAAYVGPNDPLLAMQWHYKSNGSDATKGQSAGGSGFTDFWSKQRQQGSRNVVVAVVDTGLQMDHPDMVGSPNIATGFDMVSDILMGNDGDGRDEDANDPGDKCNPDDPNQSDTFHGTHVAGIVGAALTNNGAGVSGGAWNVTVVPVRALGRCGGRLSDINDSIRWAAGLIPGETSDGREVWNSKPADVINLSLGLFERCPASMQQAIDEAVARGSIVVAAAGNARLSTAWYAPAGCRNVVTVAAGDGRGQIAPYSNYGAEVDILAPGGDVFRDDDADGKPDGVLSTKAAKNCVDPVTGGFIASCNYAYENGTSMAAPHVSAALALLKASQPTATPAQLVERLLAATRSRTPSQCMGQCTHYPGSTPLADQPGMCLRPCGRGLLDLALAVTVPPTGGGTGSGAPR